MSSLCSVKQHASIWVCSLPREFAGTIFVLSRKDSEPAKYAHQSEKGPSLPNPSTSKSLRMGECFNEIFLPMKRKLVEAGKSYDEVKRLVKIAST